VSINIVAVSGNLTRDPELRSTAGGTAILQLGIAVNDRRKNQQSGEWEDVPNFFDVKVFGTRAESLSRFLAKGSKIAVQGKLSWSSWEDKNTGDKRSKVEIIADNIEFMSAKDGASSPSPRPAPDDDDIPFAVLPTERRFVTRCGHERF
jgi:single-strand DNA-binding protein